MTSVETIDLNYLGQPEAIAAYLITADEPILIECGPGSTTDALTRGLSAHGLKPRDVRHLFVTHIHLDHAGAAGWLASHGANVYVHEFGAPHLVNPEKLLASAKRIYRDRMDVMWGDVLPCPEAGVTAVRDGERFEITGVAIRAVETPGHARHHHSFVVEGIGERIGFTGDAAGTFVHECPAFQSLPTPPPEFDLEAWLASVERVREEQFAAIYPTHFGRVERVDEHLDGVSRALKAHTKFIETCIERGDDEQTVEREYRQWFRAEADALGVPDAKRDFYISRSLTAMNVSGIMRYLRQRASERDTMPASGA